MEVTAYYLKVFIELLLSKNTKYPTQPIAETDSEEEDNSNLTASQKVQKAFT